jgi:hypothetical protein
MYLGNTPTQQAFTPVVDTFSGNGSTTAFTLSRSVAAVAQVEAVIENVVQSPVDAYTVSGNTITFTSAPPSGSSNIYVRYTSPITQVMQPTDGSVGLRQLNSDLQGTTYGMKNRIINGAMVIDQRNAGASVTPTDGQYTLDRWLANVSQASKLTVQRNAGAVTPPAGFTNYLGVTSSASTSVGAGDYFSLRQVIEGFNIADLGWGTASAATITLSFWVRSSLTGAFGGSLVNGVPNRSYPFTYTINAANTWELKSVTIAGDTTGTWSTDNSGGIRVNFGLGVGSTLSGTAGAWASGNYFSATGATSVVGTNGATFYITGVQLEKGSTATSYDFRSYGTELALCQRYYYRQSVPYPVPFGVGSASGTGGGRLYNQFPVIMRIAPTALEQSGTASDYTVWDAGTTVACSAVPTFSSASTSSATTNITVASGLTTGHALIGLGGGSGYLGWSVEL